LVVGFSPHVIADVVLGIGAGILWRKLLPFVAEQQFGNALNLGVVLAVFSIGRRCRSNASRRKPVAFLLPQHRTG
jgi:hypothetical protein